MTALDVIMNLINFCKIFLSASHKQNAETVISQALPVNFAMSVRLSAKHAKIHQRNVIRVRAIVFLMKYLILVIVQLGLSLILNQ